MIKSQVQTQNRQVWLEPGFVIYNSPYDTKEISSSLSLSTRNGG